MSTPDSTPTSRRGQIAQTYRMAKRSDPRLGLIVLGTFLVGAALGFGLMWLLPGDYTVEATQSALRGSATFTVGAAPGQPVRIELR